MAGNENSGERLFVLVTNKGPVRRHVNGVLTLETDDNYSVLANRVDPQGVAALLDRCGQRFSNSRGKCLSQKSADDVEVEDSNAPSPSARKMPPQAAVAMASRVRPVKQSVFLTPPKPNDSPGLQSKVSSRGVTLLTELTRMYKEGIFQGDAKDLNKTMFFDENHTHYVRVPATFSEQSLYKYAMLALAMGITTKQLMELNNSTLDEDGLWTLVNAIAEEVHAKRISLERVYGMRHRDDAGKACFSITGMGRNFKKLKAKMIEKCGKMKAHQLINQHTGVYGTDGELQQQKLDTFFG